MFVLQIISLDCIEVTESFSMHAFLGPPGLVFALCIGAWARPVRLEGLSVWEHLRMNRA